MHQRRGVAAFRSHPSTSLIVFLERIRLPYAAPLRPKNQANQLTPETKLDFADFFPPTSDAGPKDRRFCDDAHGLFDGSCSASKGAERRPSFFPE